MTYISRSSWPARRRVAGLAAAAAALSITATLAPTGAATAGPATDSTKAPSGASNAAEAARTADVMTRNLYLGAGLDEILDALTSGNQNAIVGAATNTWRTVQASDPEERMAAIAVEIVENRPAVIGLQEVTTWSTYPFDPTTGQVGAPTVAYDFLELLLAELAERGVTYHEVDGATAHNFTSAPIPVLAGQPYPTMAVKLADRDVILRRDDVRTWNAHSGNFQTILKPPASPLTVDRGWGSADVRTRLATFRFVNAHTEAFGPEIIRVGEVTELFAAQDLITADHGALPTVYVGDYNSDAPRLDAPGQGGYATLLTRLDDAWVTTNGAAALGDTCCQAADLSNTASELDKRIDLVMTGDGVTATAAHMTGTTAVDLPGETWWASDHAGVVARLVFEAPAE